jgi:hypothetical protein
MIRVRDLDGGYETVSELIRVEESSGAKVVTDLADLIGQLREHWIGNDATENLNELIDVHDELQEFLVYGLKTATDAQEKMVEMQEVRRANGGAGLVGEVKKASEEFVSEITKLDKTAEFYCDPAARQDYETLKGIKANFTEFKNNFLTIKDELMNNWESGNNRDEAKQKFDEFEEMGTEFENVMKKTEEQLGTVISNTDKIMDE